MIRRLLLGSLLLLLGVCPAEATWAIVQNPTPAQGNSTVVTSFQQTVTATGSGHLLIGAFVWNSNAVVISSADISGTAFTQCTSALAQDATSGSTDIWYIKNSPSGKTVITMNLSGSGANFPAIAFYEISGMDTSAPVDLCGNKTDDTGTLTPSSAAITTTAVGDFLVANLTSEVSITGIHAGNEFTSDNVSTEVVAHITSTSATAGSHQAQWDASSGGHYAMSIGAFKISAGAPACTPTLMLVGIGRCGEDEP